MADKIGISATIFIYHYYMFVSKTEPSFDKYDEPRLHIERLYRTRLAIFDLPLPTLIRLENGRVKTIGDLCSCTRRQIRSIKGIGATSYSAIMQLLYRLGLEPRRAKRRKANR